MNGRVSGEPAYFSTEQSWFRVARKQLSMFVLDHFQVLQLCGGQHVTSSVLMTPKGSKIHAIKGF